MLCVVIIRLKTERVPMLTHMHAERSEKNSGGAGCRRCSGKESLHIMSLITYNVH